MLRTTLGLTPSNLYSLCAAFESGQGATLHTLQVQSCFVFFQLLMISCLDSTRSSARQW